MKKIMVVSDTHKHHRNLARALEQAGTPDLLIHLGDAEGYEDYIADMAGCPLEIVSGNNDFFSMLDKEKEIRIGKYKVLLTHGHYYYVSAGLDTLRKEAASIADLFSGFLRTFKTSPALLYADRITSDSCT